MDEQEVQKRALIYEVEDEVWKLIKRRAWVVVVLVAFLGVGGIWANVQYTVRQVADGPLRELQRQLVLVEVQADAAKRANAAATAAADQVSRNVSSLQANLQQLDDRAKAVADQFSIVSQQIDAASKNAALRSQRDFNAAQERITALEMLVKQIGEENAATRKATADYARQVAALKADVEKEQKRFAENSAYTVLIHASPDKRNLATEIQTRLASAGFRAALTETTGKLERNSLVYSEKSEAKAKEVLSLLKPVLRTLEITKIPDLAGRFPTTVKDLKGYSSLPGGAVVSMFYMWQPDANSFILLVSG